MIGLSAASIRRTASAIASAAGAAATRGVGEGIAGVPASPSEMSLGITMTTGPGRPETERRNARAATSGTCEGVSGSSTALATPANIVW